MPSWFDFALQTFCSQLKSLPENGNYTEFVQREMENLMKVYIDENLSTCSDIQFHEQLAKFIVAREQFMEITTKSSEYDVRRTVGILVKRFVSNIDASRRIKITDRTRFALQMEILGLNIGHSRFRGWIPDGGMFAMAALCVAVVAICNKV